MKLSLADSRLLAEGTPFALKDALKALPGARAMRGWDEKFIGWSYPASPTIAAALAALLPEAQRDAEVDILIEANARGDSAQQHKVSDTLPDIPLVVLPPWKHQLRAYHFAKDLPAAMLALDMATGKSRVVVDLVVNLDMRRVLILCPLSVVGVWPGQFDRHAAGTVRVLALDEGSVASKTKQAALALQTTRDALAVVVNYESAWREPMAKVLLKQEWDAVVADEGHRCKAPGGKASMYLARLRDRAKRRLILTGTPMPHSPLDLYAQYRFLDPGIFGTSFTAFRARYAIMGGFENHQVIAWQRQDEMNAKFYSIAYRVMAGDVLDLPPTQHIVWPVKLSPEEMRVYRDIERDMIAAVKNGVITTANALVKLLRLAQATSGYSKLDVEAGQDEGRVVQIGTSKREALADILDGLPRREPVVCFARFHHDLDMVQEVCDQQGRVYGELSGRRRDGLTATGTMNPDCDVVGVQIQSGGVGIDLTRAHYAIYFSVSYSLGEYEQSLARLNRPGQERPVAYYHLVAAKTTDETTYEALDAKRDVVESVLANLASRGVGQ